MIRKLFLSFVLTAMVALTTSVAHAQLSLGALIAGNGSIQVGDKLFSNFTLEGAGSLFPLLATANVVGEISPNDLVCLNIQGNLIANPLDALTAVLGFQVTTVDADCEITKVGLTVNGVDLPVGATASITENVFASAGGELLGTATLNSFVAGSGMEMVTLGEGHASVYVQKNISFAGVGDVGGIGQVATLGTIQQCFTQNCVPEPGSLALLATGGLPLLRALRRRKR